MNTVEKRVIGYLAEETWTTFCELNEAILERLTDINENIHRPDGTTRQERFDAEETPFLMPLSELPFESLEWKSGVGQHQDSGIVPTGSPQHQRETRFAVPEAAGHQSDFYLERTPTA